MQPSRSLVTTPPQSTFCLKTTHFVHNFENFKLGMVSF
jgi:hypothetical protein